MKRKLVQLVVLSVINIAVFYTFYSVYAQTSTRRIEITAKRFEFSPADITLKKGEPVVIVLKSADVAHGLRFRRLGLDLHADKGQTTELPFTPAKTGDFTGQCSVFCGSGHGKMKLTLHIVE
jgi:cytochrome c oxidase subunit II